MHATYPIRPFLGFLVFAAALGAASAQTPPPELTLKAKVRDFVDRTMAEATVNPHPHFYGDVPHQVLCNAVAQGVNIAQADIAVDDGIGDTAQFKADNRGPRLVAPLDPRVEHCFEPVARFSDWYNDVPGVNRAFLVDLVFSYNTATRRYEYFKDDYFPLDNGAAYQPLGAYTTFGHQIPGHTGHNFGFTLELHTKFSYFAGKGQTFEFRGDDDIWVFINGKRVIDLGGMHEHQTAVVNLDAVAASLGLTDSLSYPLDFFFAERHVTTSMLRISTDLELEAVLSDPILTPGGFFQGQKEVTITHSSDKVTLYYTTDGTTPDATSQVYTPGTPITLSTTTTLKVIALRPGFHSSQVVSATYTRQDTVATPAATPKGQSFTEPLSVTLSVSTPGAVIRYTLDGTEPKETSPVYSGPIPVTATTTLKARGYLPNWLPSGLLTEVYTDAATLPPPVANPPGGGFTTSRTVSLSVPGHADADIRYTLDGQEPTASSPRY
ncbi:MAG TPA: chitobiase/beta-hexosaminidase C-terminal domain-containing protein, partial [Fibrobacteria bacterium]|nr:chitobiase/beta-hexosaminidase C-terminal domain-containing protein [Fibrobacteria bacterium]